MAVEPSLDSLLVARHRAQKLKAVYPDGKQIGVFRVRFGLRDTDVVFCLSRGENVRYYACGAHGDYFCVARVLLSENEIARIALADFPGSLFNWALKQALADINQVTRRGR